MALFVERQRGSCMVPMWFRPLAGTTSYRKCLCWPNGRRGSCMVPTWFLNLKESHHVVSQANRNHVISKTPLLAERESWFLHGSNGVPRTDRNHVIAKMSLLAEREAWFVHGSCVVLQFEGVSSCPRHVENALAGRTGVVVPAWLRCRNYACGL